MSMALTERQKISGLNALLISAANLAVVWLGGVLVFASNYSESSGPRPLNIGDAVCLLYLVVNVSIAAVAIRLCRFAWRTRSEQSAAQRAMAGTSAAISALVLAYAALIAWALGDRLVELLKGTA